MPVDLLCGGYRECARNDACLSIILLIHCFYINVTLDPLNLFLIILFISSFFSTQVIIIQIIVQSNLESGGLD